MWAPTKRKYKGFEMARVRGVVGVGYLGLRMSRVGWGGESGGCGGAQPPHKKKIQRVGDG